MFNTGLWMSVATLRKGPLLLHWVLFLLQRHDYHLFSGIGYHFGLPRDISQLETFIAHIKFPHCIRGDFSLHRLFSMLGQRHRFPECLSYITSQGHLLPHWVRDICCHTELVTSIATMVQGRLLPNWVRDVCSQTGFSHWTHCDMGIHIRLETLTFCVESETINCHTALGTFVTILCQGLSFRHCDRDVLDQCFSFVFHWVRDVGDIGIHCSHQVRDVANRFGLLTFSTRIDHSRI